MKSPKMVFQSSFTKLPDAFIFLFRVFDVLMSFVLLFAIFLCILAILLGFSTREIPGPFFTIVFFAICSYCILMIYGLWLDFSAGATESFQIIDNNIIVKKRRPEKIKLSFAEMNSITLVKVRLFTSYAYYAFLRGSHSRPVIEITNSDFEKLSALFTNSDFKEIRHASIPFFISRIIFRK